MSEASELLQRRDIQRWLARPYRVQYVPLWLTGGCSTDGSIVFLDTDLRDRPKLADRVIFHERLEAAFRHIFGFRYPKAHRLATEGERERYGPEDETLKSIVAKNIKRRPRVVPSAFDRELAREAAESVGN
jgi:hypothetical protein